MNIKQFKNLIKIDSSSYLVQVIKKLAIRGMIVIKSNVNLNLI